MRATSRPAACRRWTASVAWLKDNLPPDSGDARVVHGDFRCDNMIFAPDRAEVLAVLDWELSTLGDPAADFVYHLMMYRMPAGMFTGLAGLDFAALGIPTEEEYVAAYCRRTGRETLPHLDYLIVFVMFRIAAILHGIRGRLARGNASSAHAEATAALTEPLAELALAPGARRPPLTRPGAQKNLSQVNRGARAEFAAAGKADGGQGVATRQAVGKALSVDQPRRRWAANPDPLEGDERPTVEGVVRELRRIPVMPGLLATALIIFWAILFARFSWELPISVGPMDGRMAFPAACRANRARPSRSRPMPSARCSTFARQSASGAARSARTRASSWSPIRRTRFGRRPSGRRSIARSSPARWPTSTRWARRRSASTY